MGRTLVACLDYKMAWSDSVNLSSRHSVRPCIRIPNRATLNLRIVLEVDRHAFGDFIFLYVWSDEVGLGP